MLASVESVLGCIFLIVAYQIPGPHNELLCGCCDFAHNHEKFCVKHRLRDTVLLRLHIGQLITRL
jgi:hypothetical protein